MRWLRQSSPPRHADAETRKNQASCPTRGALNNATLAQRQVHNLPTTIVSPRARADATTSPDHGVASAFSIASRNGFASGVTFDSKNSALVPSRLTTYLLKFHFGD